MTTKEIFEKGNVLTLKIAKSLIGKKIAITSPEYKYNLPSLRIGTLTAIKSEWDLAKEDLMEDFGNRQEYWKSFFDEVQIKNSKKRMKLIGDCAFWATCYNDGKDSVFFGSDSDRTVCFIEL